MVIYCSKKCQKSDWKHHKISCSSSPKCKTSKKERRNLRACEKLGEAEIKVTAVYKTCNGRKSRKVATIYSTGLYPTFPELVAVNIPQIKAKEVIRMMNVLAGRMKQGFECKPGQKCVCARTGSILFIDSVDDPASFPQRPATTLASLQELVINIPSDAKMLVLKPCAWDLDDINSWGSKELAMSMDRIHAKVPPRAFSNHSRCDLTLDRTPFSTPDTCFKNDDNSLLCRTLPSGRLICIFSDHGKMFRGGIGLARINMIANDSRESNFKQVYECEARRMLMEFKE